MQWSFLHLYRDFPAVNLGGDNYWSRWKGVNSRSLFEAIFFKFVSGNGEHFKPTYFNVEV